MISLCDMIKFAKYIFCRAVNYWINMLSRGQVLVQSIGILGGGKTLYSTKMVTVKFELCLRSKCIEVLPGSFRKLVFHHKLNRPQLHTFDRPA